MSSKLSLFFAVSLAVFVTAQGINNSCNTGDVQCCNAVHDSKSFEANWIRQHLGINAPVDGNVGVTCSPVTAVGTGSGAECKQAPMCCSGNHFEGLIVVGCSPISASL